MSGSDSNHDARSSDGDPDWRVPLGLAKTIYIAQVPEKQVVSSPGERNNREFRNVHNLTYALPYLVNKYRDHCRTSTLLRSIEAGQRDFVLYLPRFPKESGTVDAVVPGDPDDDDLMRRVQIARWLGTLPLLWVSEPTYDFAPQLNTVALALDIDYSYRLELGATWESDIRELIRAARVILMDGSFDSAGTSLERSAVAECGREDDLVVLPSHDAPTAPLLSEDTLRSIERRLSPSDSARPKPHPLPASCLWIAGAKREAVEAKRSAAYAIMAQFVNKAEHAAAPSLDDALLAVATILVYSIALEDVAYFTEFALWACTFADSIDDAVLPNAADLANFYRFLIAQGETVRAFPAAPRAVPARSTDAIAEEVRRFFPCIELAPGTAEPGVIDLGAETTHLEALRDAIQSNMEKAREFGEQRLFEAMTSVCGYLEIELERDGLISIRRLHQARGTIVNKYEGVRQLGSALVALQATHLGSGPTAVSNVQARWDGFYRATLSAFCGGMLPAPLYAHQVEEALYLGRALARLVAQGSDAESVDPFLLRVPDVGVICVETNYRRIVEYATQCATDDVDADPSELEEIVRKGFYGPLRTRFGLTVFSPHKKLGVWRLGLDGTSEEMSNVSVAEESDSMYKHAGEFTYPPQDELGMALCFRFRVPKFLSHDEYHAVFSTKNIH